MGYLVRQIFCLPSLSNATSVCLGCPALLCTSILIYFLFAYYKVGFCVSLNDVAIGFCSILVEEGMHTHYILFKINCSWLYDHALSSVYFDIELLNHVNVDFVSLTNFFL